MGKSPSLRPLPLPTASTPVSPMLDQTRPGIHPAGETASGPPSNQHPCHPACLGQKGNPEMRLDGGCWWTGGPIESLPVVGGGSAGGEWVAALKDKER